MRMRTNNATISEKRMLTNIEAAQYLGLGLRTTRSMMDQIGATVKVGRRVLFDKRAIDNALDQNLFGDMGA